MTFETEMKERLAAANSAAGWDALTDEEQRWSDEYSDKLAETVFHNPGSGPIGRSEIGRIIAAETIEKWNRSRRIRPESYKPFSRQPIWRAELPSSRIQPDMVDPSTMFKLICILAHKPNKAYPIDKFHDWTHVIRPDYFGCDVRISADCMPCAAFHAFPLSRGEYVTVHKFCDQCLRWFYAHTSELVALHRRELQGVHHIEPTNTARLDELKSFNLCPPVIPTLRVL